MARTRRTAADRLRGLLALLAILALLVGIPAALIALQGNPLPDSVANLNDVLDAVTQPDDGSLLLGALTWLAWAGWASFAVSITTEAIAQLRGLPSPHLLALGPQQRLAGALVGTTMLLLTAPLLQATPAQASPVTPTTASSTLAPEQRSVVPTSSQAPSVPSAAPSPDVRATSPQPYTVQPGDSLWQIATEQLGDGARYPEIAQLNYGLAQGDGAALTSDHWLRPGWRLVMPAAPTTSDTSRSTAPSTVVVQPGDSLWQIAAEQLGDGARYPEIAQASDHTQADGGRLTNPDLIRPGWELTVPGAAGLSTDPEAASPALTAELTPTPLNVPPPAPVVEPAEPPQAAEASPAPAEPAPAQAPTEAAGETAAPPAAQRTPGDGQAEAPNAPAVALATSGAEADLDDDEQTPIRTLAGIGALLAAGHLALLGTRRARQQRHRRPGQRIAMPPLELAPMELALRLVEDPVGLARVDRALRTLARSIGQQEAVLPPLRLVRLAQHHLELYLADPVELPAPFTATDDPSVWTLAADAPLLTEEQAKTVAAPYPSLVTIGHDLDGAHLLLDLEHAGSLNIDGALDTSVAILIAIACELATSSWADDLQVTVIGDQPQLALLPPALGATRVRHLSSLNELLPALQHRADDVRAALASHNLTDLHHARTDPSGQSDIWTPEIVLLTGPVPAEDLAQLDAVVQELPRVGVAAVTAAVPSSSEWALTLDPGDTGLDAVAVLAPMNVSLRPQRLGSPELDQLLALLEVADRPAEDPIGDSPFTPTLITAEPALADLGRGIDPAIESDTSAPILSPPTGTKWWLPNAVSVPASEPADASTPDKDDTDDSASVAAEPVLQIDLDRPAADEPPADLPPLIQFLGPVEVLHARGATERSKQRQLTEIAAYLALHPGLNHAHLTEAIWPGARTVDNTRNTALSKLRKWLGTDPDGVNYVPRVDNGYRLHPAVRSDWQLWQALLPRGPATADTAELAAALELVKGKPFAGTNPRRYAWAEVDRQNMISAIVDAAHELARRALLEADATLARRAAAAGLQADPGAELLWRDALRAEWLAGDMTGLTSTADRLSALVDDLDDDLEPETIELLEQLLARPANHATVR